MKTRLNKIKFVRGEKQNFLKKGFEYNINPHAIYMKKFLGLKIFRYSQYIEGQKAPIIYDFEKGGYFQKIVRIDYIAQLIQKLKFMKLEIIMIILLAVILITNIVVIQQIGGS